MGFDGVDNRRDRGFYGVPYSRENGFYAVQHTAEERTDRVPYRGGRRFDAIPGVSDKGFHGIPHDREGRFDSGQHSRKEAGDRIPYRGRHIFNAVDGIGEESFNGIPGIDEKGLHARPYRIPVRAEPGKESIRDTLQHVKDGRENALDAVPYPGENLLHPGPCLIPVSGKDPGKHIKQACQHIKDRTENSGNNLKRRLEYRSQYRAESIPYRFQHLGDVFKVKTESVQPVGDPLGKGLELRFDTVPDRDDLVAEFLVVLPEIDKGSYQDSDHADHSQHRPGYTAEGYLQCVEHASRVLYRVSDFEDSLSQLGKSLHARSHCGDHLSQHNQQRADGSGQSRDLQDGLLLGIGHPVQLIHEILNLTDNFPDDRHQQLAEGDRQLFQLGFQDGQLPFQVVLHGCRHAFRRAVTVFNGRGQLVDILRSCVHQSKEAGHSVLSHQGLCRRSRFRFGKAGKSHTAVSQDIGKLPHGAVRVGGRNGHVTDRRAGDLHLAREVIHDGTKRRTCLASLDTGICHQADGFRCILRREPQGTRDRRTVLEGLTHEGDIRVGIGACRRQDIRKVAGVGCLQTEGSQGIRHDVRCGRQVFT